MNTGMTQETSPDRMRYDVPTVLFHWSCAAIIVLQFISANIWGLFRNPLHHQLVVVHLTAGMVLTTGHALAACFYYLILRDNVLQRMFIIGNISDERNR